MIEVLLIVALTAGWLRAGEPQRDSAVRFEPVKVVAATPTIYPMLSIASGTVILRIEVNNAGAVEKVDVVHGIPSLTEEAERSVRQWKFKPALLNGKPWVSDITASFSFSRPLPLGLPLKLTPTSGEQTPLFAPVEVDSAIQAFYPAAVITSGTVILQVIVGSSGAIDRVKTIQGIQWLTEQAEQAVKEWKFEPARLDGKPVASPMIASFIFAFSLLLNSHNR
ncbi:MAG: energy transducer TonB [Terriglobia bacterium]